MAQTIDVIRDRIASICASAPFSFIEAVSPFGFDLQPTGQIDQVFRIEYGDGSVVGGLNYSEVRIVPVRIFIARKQNAAPKDAYALLAADAEALLIAVVHDGATGGGDYCVEDQGRAMAIQHDRGKEYAVLRLTVPVNFEAEL